MVSESKLQAMALEYWGEQGETRTTEMMVEFAKLVLAEAERVRKIENVRMACAREGHNFSFRGSNLVVGDFLLEDGVTWIRGWNGSGKCVGCGAILGVTYQEEL